MAKVLEAAEVTVGRNRAELDLMNRWLERGDGVAVYENVDLGHPELGHRQILSYGSREASLKVAGICATCGDVVDRLIMGKDEGCFVEGCVGIYLAQDPPERLPDWGDQINWRYMLQGVYWGPAL